MGWSLSMAGSTACWLRYRLGQKVTMTVDTCMMMTGMTDDGLCNEIMFPSGFLSLTYIMVWPTSVLN
jgi:hypothetical protein